MYKMKAIFLFFVFFSFLFSEEIKNVELDLSKIQNYKIIKEQYLQKNREILLIREFQMEKKAFYLAIDPNSLETLLVEKNEELIKAKEDILKNSNFEKLTSKADKNKLILANAGINAPLNLNNKKYLTIDMCPSGKKGFEKEFFQNIINLQKTQNQKIPIAVAITYDWVLGHKEEFLWLINHKNSLDITWINHSKTHFYDRKEEDLSKNFMLRNKKDFENEVVDVEKMLILNHQTPSILFRFPGLISDKELVEKLLNIYSLVPLGTNNWLVKTQKEMGKNDIVLVHGNLNEHLGIEMINKTLKKSVILNPIFEALILPTKK